MISSVFDFSRRSAHYFVIAIYFPRFCAIEDTSEDGLSLADTLWLSNISSACYRKDAYDSVPVRSRLILVLEQTQRGSLISSQAMRVEDVLSCYI